MALLELLVRAGVHIQILARAHALCIVPQRENPTFYARFPVPHLSTDPVRDLQVKRDRPAELCDVDFRLY